VEKEIQGKSKGEKIDKELDEDEKIVKKPRKVSFNPLNESPSKDTRIIEAMGLETGKNVDPDEFKQANKEKAVLPTKNELRKVSQDLNTAALKKSTRVFKPKTAATDLPEKKLRKGSKSFLKSKKFYDENLKSLFQLDFPENINKEFFNNFRPSKVT